MTTKPRPTAVYLLPHTPYPPVSGGARRSANIAEVLSEHFDLTLLIADDLSASDREWRNAAARFVGRRHSRRSLLLDTPVSVVRGRHVLQERAARAGLERSFETQLAVLKPDFVLLAMPFVGPFLRAALRDGRRVVLDAESLSKIAWEVARSRHSSVRHRIRALVEAAFVLGRIERGSFPRATEVWIASELERPNVESLVLPDRIRVVPNVVDVPDVRPDPAPVRSLGFVGSYIYPPNEAAALELVESIAPVVRQRGGPRIVKLIGSAPTPAIISAAAADPEVVLLGQVPDVRESLREAGVLVVPVRAGSGTRVKILEAMAAGVPVVSTRLGAEGLDLEPESHFLLAETPGQFADQVIRVTSDAALRSGLTERAHAHVHQRYSMRQLRSVIAQAVA